MEPLGNIQALTPHQRWKIQLHSPTCPPSRMSPAIGTCSHCTEDPFCQTEMPHYSVVLMPVTSRGTAQSSAVALSSSTSLKQTVQGSTKALGQSFRTAGFILQLGGSNLSLRTYQSTQHLPGCLPPCHIASPFSL